MKFARTGVILNTENFEDCVSFYRNVFELKQIYEECEGDFRLCCLDFGGTYLMIETGGVAKTGGKAISECATKLRFNVDDIDLALDNLTQHGIKAEIIKNEWGSTINLHDPDGNRIGIRDEATFVQQIQNKSD
jgi:lactoylglutathione lyase